MKPVNLVCDCFLKMLSDRPPVFRSAKAGVDLLNAVEEEELPMPLEEQISAEAENQPSHVVEQRVLLAKEKRARLTEQLERVSDLYDQVRDAFVTDSLLRQQHIHPISEYASEHDRNRAFARMLNARTPPPADQLGQLMPPQVQNMASEIRDLSYKFLDTKSRLRRLLMETSHLHDDDAENQPRNDEDEEAQRRRSGSSTDDLAGLEHQQSIDTSVTAATATAAPTSRRRNARGGAIAKLGGLSDVEADSDYYLIQTLIARERPQHHQQRYVY